MIVFENRHYRIECTRLKEQHHDTYFLDRKEILPDGRVCLVNVCNGTEGYCRNTLAKLNEQILPK